MRKKIETEEFVSFDQQRSPAPKAPCIGRIAGCDDQGRILVRFDGSHPVPARRVAGVSRDALMADRNGEVLLNFADGDPFQPIIVARLAEPLQEIVCMHPDRHEPVRAVVDGELKVIEASEQIQLKCGRASILLRSDGKIVLKGIEIVSRAKQANKIKGASVQVN